MPAIAGVTTGMVRDNCMAYCDNKSKGYTYFGEKKPGFQHLSASAYARRAPLLQNPSPFRLHFTSEGRRLFHLRFSREKSPESQHMQASYNFDR